MVEFNKIEKLILNNLLEFEQMRLDTDQKEDLNYKYELDLIQEKINQS